MTPAEQEQLRTTYRQICGQLAGQLEIDVFPALQGNANPHDLLLHLNELERNVHRALNVRLSQQLNFASTLASQQDPMNLMLRVDRLLQSLHCLFAAHIDWMVQNAPEQALQTALTRLSIATVAGFELEGTSEQYLSMFREFRQIILVHYYRAWVVGGLQRELIQRLSVRFDPAGECKLELAVIHLPGMAGLDTGATDIEVSQAFLPEAGYQQIVLTDAQEQEVVRLNHQLEQEGCETRISRDDYYRLMNLVPNGGRTGANISCSVPLTQHEGARSPVDLSQDETIRRLLSGAFFIRPDRQPVYYGFHILIIHELIHVMHIIEGTVISRAAAPNLFGMNTRAIGQEWGAGGNNSNPVEELRTTFIEPLSEYNIVRLMDARVRMPYHCFVLPLAIVRINQGNWNRIDEMRLPLETYMLQNGFLPNPSSLADCCNLM